LLPSSRRGAENQCALRVTYRANSGTIGRCLAMPASAANRRKLTKLNDEGDGVHKNKKLGSARAYKTTDTAIHKQPKSAMHFTF